MQQTDIPRRTVLKGGAATAMSGMTVMTVAGPVQAFPGHADEGVVIPWFDQPPPVPPELEFNLGHPLVWEDLQYLTPNDEFFTVKHNEIPELSPIDWRLGISGLVGHPRSLSLGGLKALKRRAVTCALECSGNQTVPPFQIGLVGNARWAGASLREVLKRARPLDEATEVIFRGADAGLSTIRDNTAVFSGGDTGEFSPETGLRITERFARSMSLEDAMNPDNLLCYEMNGSPLPQDHGAPVRLIAPDWYGVANVKWLTQIELTDSRYQGRFMAREYVTIREEDRGSETLWTFTSVTHERLKSAPAKVTRRGDKYTVLGAAWGAPIAKVEVQVDDEAWRPTRLARNLHSPHGDEAAWKFWTFHWGTPSAGEHTIRSRAYDKDGNVQPAPDAPSIANRRTFYENNGHVTRSVLIP